MWNKHFDFQGKLNYVPVVIDSSLVRHYLQSLRLLWCFLPLILAFFSPILSQLVCDRRDLMSAILSEYKNWLRRLQANCLNLQGEKKLLALDVENCLFFIAWSNYFSVRKESRNRPINISSILKPLLWSLAPKKKAHYFRVFLPLTPKDGVTIS